MGDARGDALHLAKGSLPHHAQQLEVDGRRTHAHCCLVLVRHEGHHSVQSEHRRQHFRQPARPERPYNRRRWWDLAGSRYLYLLSCSLLLRSKPRRSSSRARPRVQDNLVSGPPVAYRSRALQRCLHCLRCLGLCCRSSTARQRNCIGRARLAPPASSPAPNAGGPRGVLCLGSRTDGLSGSASEWSRPVGRTRLVATPATTPPHSAGARSSRSGVGRSSSQQQQQGVRRLLSSRASSEGLESRRLSSLEL